MSSNAAEIFATSAQSRRVACDRCHRLKLRCERNPVLENDPESTAHGACRRCTKAQKSCSRSSNSTSRPRVPSSDQNATQSNHAPLTPFPSASPSVLSNDINISNLESVCGHDPTLVNGFDTVFDFDNLDNLASNSIGTPGIFGAQPNSKRHSDTEDYGNLVALPPLGPQAYSPIPTRNEDTSNGTSPNDCSGVSEYSDDFARGVLELQSILFGELRAISSSDLAEAFRTATTRQIESNRNGGLVDRLMRASEYTIDLLHSPYLADNLRANNASPAQSRFGPFRSTSVDITKTSFRKARLLNIEPCPPSYPFYPATWLYFPYIAPSLPTSMTRSELARLHDPRASLEGQQVHQWMRQRASAQGHAASTAKMFSKSGFKSK